jgi:hypothetical protein
MLAVAPMAGARIDEFLQRVETPANGTDDDGIMHVASFIGRECVEKAVPSTRC